MRLLVDECVDWRLLRDLESCSPKSVKQLGWEHCDDGELLRLASSEFDVFLTVDKDLPQQQNLARFDLAVVILRARTTRLADLRALLPLLRDVLQYAKPGNAYVVSWRDLISN
jgi:predicted nuclease of predicted toxin-antitoxin system